MIVDDSDGSYGTLIDWEFAMRIIEGDHYTIGGTVSNLLFLMNVALTTIRGQCHLCHGNFSISSPRLLERSPHVSRLHLQDHIRPRKSGTPTVAQKTVRMFVHFPVIVLL